jgi:hypothetical protein
VRACFVIVCFSFVACGASRAPASGATHEPAIEVAPDAIDDTVASSTCAALGLPSCTEGEHEDERGSTYTIARQTYSPVGAPSTTPFRARLLSFQMEAYGGGGPRGVQALVQWLVVDDGERSSTLRVRADDASLVTDVGEARPTRFEWRDVVPGDSPELVLDVSGMGGDHSLCARDAVSDRSLVLCAARPLRCLALALAHETEHDDYPDCDEGTGERIETTRTGYRVDARIDDGAVTLTTLVGEPPASLVGRYTLADLLQTTTFVTWRP